MKKNRKRIISLLMAAAVFMTSGMTVYASQEGDAGAPAAEAGSAAGQEAGTEIESTEGQKSAAGQEAPGGSTDEGSRENPENPADQNDAAGQNGNGQNNGAGENQSPVEGTIEQPAPEENKGTGENQSPVEGTVITGENSDEVTITENDRPYLALGADLTDAQRATVLSIMQIDPANLSNYDVVYVTNAEEHQYLDAYISSAQIGSRSLSSVVIVKREKGSGLNISTSNINYCTVGMYKNALTTAGIADADIIVAGPTGISGTAALVGIFKAYQEMTGETIGDNVVDAALHELVITGQLEDSIEGLTDEEVEEFIAYIKSVIAENNLSDEESINKAIDDACDKYGVTLSDEERQQIIDLLLKITSLGIDLNGLVDYAASLYNSFKNGGSSDGVFAAIGNFFSELFTSIGNFFKNLFS